MDIQQDPRRIQTPSSTDLAWAAGFFDGEGTFSYGSSLAASIAQVNRDNLFRFKDAVGVGRISSPQDHGHKPISYYRAYSDGAMVVSRKLWRFLGSEKQDQFLRMAIRWCFRTVATRKGNPLCKRGHKIAEVGRYFDHDCNKCRRLRRSGEIMPKILPVPTAFSLRLHGIREYSPEIKP